MKWRFGQKARAARAGRTVEFADPRIAGLPTQDLRELVSELFGHVRQLRADVQGVANAQIEINDRLREVVYREDSRFVAWAKAAKDMVEVEPHDPAPLSDERD